MKRAFEMGRPRPAPPNFPFLDHRSMAQVLEAEVIEVRRAELARDRRAADKAERLAREDRRRRVHTDQVKVRAQAVAIADGHVFIAGHDRTVWS